MKFAHMCIRVKDPDASVRFYETLGFERRGKLDFGEAYNIYLGLPGDGDTVELTVNAGRKEPYDLGTGYGHIALVAPDLDELLARLAAQGIEPEKPPYSPGGRTDAARICFVQDPDGYRVELIDREFSPASRPMTTAAGQTALQERVGALLGGDPEAAQDPYPLYDVLRSTSPAFRYGNSTILTSHALVKSAYLNPVRFPSPKGRLIAYDDRFALLSREELDLLAEITDFEQYTISRRNGEEHRRHRMAMQRAFTRPRIAAMRDAIQEIVDGVIAANVDGDVVDFMQIAYRVPLLVIMDMLGAPREDAELVKEFGNRITEPNARIPLEPAVVRSAHASLQDYKVYAEELVDRNRRLPGRTDLVSLLLDAEEDDRLTQIEVVATFLHLLFAGHETTTNLIGNAVFVLLARSDDWRQVVADPGLVDGAVEEILRFESPVQFIGRIAGEDMDIGGVEVAAGSAVILGDGPANRDPTVFADPDRFDLFRKPNDHITFGLGAHFCIGAPVARLEAQIVLDTLAHRYPDVELAVQPETVEWLPRTTFRGVSSLPVSLGEAHV